MKKSAGNCKTSQKFGVSRQVLDKIRAHQCENLHCLKDILINFHIFFYFMKKSYLVLKLGNLATLLLNCREKLFFKKSPHTLRGAPHAELLFCDDCS